VTKIFASKPDFSPDDAATGARLIADGHELLLHPHFGARSQEELIPLVTDCVVAIVSIDPFTATAIAANTALRSSHECTLTSYAGSAKSNHCELAATYEADRVSC
jgi:hypothetical protein